MAKYRKKPVVIEAVRWNGKFSDGSEWPTWFSDAAYAERMLPRGDGKILIFTLEGAMVGDVGDMIIQGVKGEIYPCKPDIFEATYELVE